MDFQKCLLLSSEVSYLVIISFKAETSVFDIVPLVYFALDFFANVANH